MLRHSASGHTTVVEIFLDEAPLNDIFRRLYKCYFGAHATVRELNNLLSLQKLGQLHICNKKVVCT